MNGMNVALQVRILLICAIFILIYEFFYKSVAFAWVFYFILSDLTDIESDTEAIKGDREQWKDFLIRRKHF